MSGGRIERNVDRGGAALAIDVDGVPIAATAGETLATALLAAGVVALRLDRHGAARGMFCNMGTCCECMVDIVSADGNARPARACLVDVADGMSVRLRAGYGR